MGRIGKICGMLRSSVYVFGYYRLPLRNRKLLVRGGEKGLRCALEMATAKYLVVHGALPSWYTKRDGQVIVRVAGEPVKCSYDMGNVQRSYLCADAIICRDAAMRDAIADAYDLDGLYRGRWLMGEDTEKRCESALRGEAGEPAPQSDRENILIFVNGLRKNGQTTSLNNLFAQLDLSRRNYCVAFDSKSLSDDPSRLDMLPEGVKLLPMPYMRQESLGEKLAVQLYLKKNCTRLWVMKRVERYYDRLYRRSFGCCRFDWVIDHNGYDKNVLNMLPMIPSKRAVFVHNDMISEMATRHIQHRPTLERVYRACERVVPVTEDIVEPTAKLSGRRDNIFVVNNCHDWQGVLRRGEEPVCFDPDTASNVPEAELMRMLEGDSIKIITIGRYSPEKGHAQLLEAFERFHREVPNSCLIIIGGHGVLYGETLRRASELECRDSVALIRSMKNPMPILKRCDLFALSSLYEGLGLVLLEADALGVPVISTDITGPRGFLRAHGGTLVPPNAEGLYQGMRDFAAGRIKPMNVDYAKYNRQAVAQFEAMLEDK